MPSARPATAPSPRSKTPTSRSRRPLATPKERRRGTISSKGPGKFLVRTYVGRRPDGSHQYASRVITGTRSQAERALTALQSEVDRKDYVEPSRRTVAEYLDTWVERRAGVTARTLADYRTRISRDVVPHIGAGRLDRLRRDDLQALVSTLAAGGLSARTIRYSLGILKHALKDAVTGGTLVRNPADHVELPKKQRKEMAAFTATQVHRLLAGTEGTEHHALWAVLTLGGLRPGEAFALRWDDLQDGALHVVRALKKGEGDTYFIGEPKTARGRRVVPLPSEALTALKEHKRRQASAILAAGKKYKRNGLIFANCVGQPLDIAKVRRQFKAALKVAGLPEVRLYDLRHTHVSIALAAGIPVHAVSARVGHADVSMTLGTYAHLLPGMQEGASDKLSAMLQKAAG